jgi:hypothetical protein
MESFPRPHPAQCLIHHATEKERVIKRQVAQYRRDLLHCVAWLSWGVVESLGVVGWDAMVAAQQASRASAAAAAAAAEVPGVR